MVLLWSSLATRRVALMTKTLQCDAAGAAGRRLGDLRALPRRHRLGDHRGGRRRGRGGRRTCTGASSPTSTPATSPARSRAARASRPTRRPARRARAARPPRWPGWRRRRDELARSSPSGRLLLLHAVAFAHGGLPLIYMGDELGLLQRPGVGGRRGARAATTAGCTGRRWTGRRRSGATTRRRSRDGSGPGCSAWSRCGAARAPSTRRASVEADLDRQRPRLRPAARARRRPPAAARELLAGAAARRDRGRARARARRGCPAGARALRVRLADRARLARAEDQVVQ